MKWHGSKSFFCYENLDDIILSTAGQQVTFGLNPFWWIIA